MEIQNKKQSEQEKAKPNNECTGKKMHKININWVNDNHKKTDGAKKTTLEKQPSERQ